MALAIVCLFLASAASVADASMSLARKGVLKAEGEARSGEALGVRQQRVEQLAFVEKEALDAQQKAIDELVDQEAKLMKQQDGLEKEQAAMAIQLQRLRGSALYAALENVAHDNRQPGPLQLLVTSIVYIIFAVIFGWIYGFMFTYEYPSLRTPPIVTRQYFSKGLFSGFDLDPDWRICCCSFFCIHARWADTVSSMKISFMPFWPALITFAVLSCIFLNRLTYGLTYLAWLVIVVNARQEIRKVYHLPTGGITLMGDCLAWMFCPWCAVMQETLEVEFVEPSAEPVPFADFGKAQEMENAAEGMGGTPPMTPHSLPPQSLPPGSGPGPESYRQ